jgi:hypothetical protein
MSLGTNESFDKLVSTDYFTQLNVFDGAIVKKILQTFLITTPPPSQFKRKFPNTFVADYTQRNSGSSGSSKLCRLGFVFEFWEDLFGIHQKRKEGLIGADKVHYTKAGYEKQGQLLTDAFLEAFQLFNSENGK